MPYNLDIPGWIPEPELKILEGLRALSRPAAPCSSRPILRRSSWCRSQPVAQVSRPRSTCPSRRRPHTARCIPVLPAERVEVERWQPGYWRWNGYEHVWTEGYYVARPRPRAEWISGRWEQRPRGWVYVEGHWN